MQKDELEKLIDGKPDDIKGKGVLLFNAHLQAQLNVKNDPSAQNYKSMRAAFDALEEFRTAQGGGRSGENFINIAAVLEHLEKDWKVTKTSLYRHHKEGKILSQNDGTFLQSSVDKYANTFLKQKATGKRKQDKLDELQRNKIEQELKNLQLKNEREEFNYQKDRGLYILKSLMDLELASRAGILVNGFKHWIQTNVADWIVTVGGDTRKAGELINKMNNDLDEHINHYAGSREYEVIIEASEELSVKSEE